MLTVAASSLSFNVPVSSPAPVSSHALVRSRPIVLQNPTKTRYDQTGSGAGVGPPIFVGRVPNPDAPGQTSGLSWYKPGEGAVFDPFNLVKSEADFERFRYAEIKHGRVAMLAVLGHVTAASGARWPGVLEGGRQFTDIKGSGYAALEQCGPATWAAIIITCGFLETRVFKEVVKGEFPGDLRNGLFKEGWDDFSDRVKKNKINKELNNGRAAMMGILALMVHEAIDGKPYVLNEMLGLGQPY